MLGRRVEQLLKIEPARPHHAAAFSQCFGRPLLQTYHLREHHQMDTNDRTVHRQLLHRLRQEILVVDRSGARPLPEDSPIPVPSSQG